MSRTHRTAESLRTASRSWLIVARRKADTDERAAATRAAQYCRREAWRMDAAAMVKV